MSKNYRLIDHTADIAILVTARDIRSLFLNSAYALLDVMFNDSNIENKRRIKIRAKGENTEELLINFLRELFSQFAVYKFVMKDIVIDLFSDNEISADVNGEKYDEKKHLISTDIKAVTYHNVNIIREDDNYNVTIVFDT